MKVLVLSDNTFPINIDSLCNLLNSTCESVRFAPSMAPIRIDEAEIRAHEVLPRLLHLLGDEASGYDYVFVATFVPYDNNFFFESFKSVVLFSFSGWNVLTDLPVTNGLIYFIASILCDRSGYAHHENTGCINDFWWDKTGVDVGMRAAFLCGACRSKYNRDEAILSDAEKLLDLVSSASRINRDVLSISTAPARGAAAEFDVFLCHNSEDKVAIRRINRDLQRAGVRTWFDEAQIRPGQVWQAELERQITEVRAACVFVGPNQRGPWQEVEIRAFLSEFVNRACPVIPVLLPGAGGSPDLPIFLRQMMWLDLRADYDSNLARLASTLSPRNSH